MTVTVKELQALTAADKGRFLKEGGSLKAQVYVARDGAVSVQFRFGYKFGGKSKTILVGTWPKTGLTEIRKERDALRVQIQAGIDPVAQRQQQREQEQAEREAELLKIEADRQEAVLAQTRRLQDLADQQARMTVKGLFEQWQRLELRQRVHKGMDVQRSFEADVFPAIGSMAAADVTKAHIVAILDAIQARADGGKTMIATVKKTLGDLRQMFGFALDREYLEVDPTARIRKARLGKDVERDRVLSEQELILLFQKLPQAGLAESSEVALLLQLSTAARIGELLSARWEHVDLERRAWTLPVTKNGKPHMVYLSKFAVRQLERLKAITGETPWLFPATRSKPGVADFSDHVCLKSVTKQVGDRQRVDAPMKNRTKLVDALVLPGGKWTPHDLRRTAATTMAELGTMPDVVERCLNHTEENKVKRIYQRAQYEGPMRDAWNLLGERLELLQARASGKDENVVVLRQA